MKRTKTPLGRHLDNGLARQLGPPQVDEPRDSVKAAWKAICEPILAPSRPLWVPKWGQSPWDASLPPGSSTWTPSG